MKRKLEELFGGWNDTRRRFGLSGGREVPQAGVFLR